MEELDGWTRLIEALDAWTSASEPAPGRIEVSVPQGAGARQVVIVMTADEWDDMAGVGWGDLDSAVQEVKRTLLGLRSDEGFAVYSDYALEPSASPALPEDPDLSPVAGGEWVTYDAEGRITSRFADSSGPAPPGPQPARPRP